jgi:hypothetical protein
MQKRHRERQETLGYWPATETGKGESVGLVTNLTEDGIQIHSKHDFLKGQILTIRISVDAMLAGTDHISLVIENVWCRASGISDLYYAGFKIIDISETAKRSLMNLFQAFSYPVPDKKHHSGENE